MTEKLNWQIENDAKNVSQRAIELRKMVAERIYTSPFQTPVSAQNFLKTPRTVWRQKMISKAELFIGQELFGEVLEIGAGTAWCSALISKKETVTRVIAMDYDEYSVDKIMPLVFTNLGADTNKISRAVGSYNSMDLNEETVDFVISIGAIHHSESLLATFGEAFRVLKKGGILVATEHCEPDSMTNAQIQQKDSALISEDTAKKLYGSQIGPIKESDNSDHSYRLVDYVSAALKTGFDAFPYTFDDTQHQADDKTEAEWDKYFSQRKCYENFRKIVIPPVYATLNATGAPVFDPLLLILQKPK